MTTDLAWRHTLAAFQPKPRRWPTPGAMALDLDPVGTRQTAALHRIDRALVNAVDGVTPRLMVFMPPQEGKSQRVSRRTPAWLLADDPTLRIAIVSYSDAKAARWGRQIRRDIQAHPALKITLREDSRAAGRWETDRGGGLICVGVAGGITGEPVDVMIIDDPVRGRKEAESATYRETAWDWWESNGSTRMSTRFGGRGVVILMMTRWHEDDLAGRLLANEPGEWTVLRIPAIAEEGDPLGRAHGEELQSVQGRPVGYFAALQAKRTPYVWLSIYQQAPSAAEGLLFKRLRWRFWRPAPSQGMGQRISLGGQLVPLAQCWRFATIDLAASTRTSADFTVAAAWALTVDNNLVLLDRARARVGEERHFDLVRPLAEKWQLDTAFVEAGQFGTTLVKAATRSGLAVTPLRADVDKTTRAIPYSDHVHQGLVWLPAEADWREEWIGEHAQFPNGAHDDQVDVGAYAVRVAVTQWAPPIPAPPRPAKAEIDLMTVPM